MRRLAITVCLALASNTTAWCQNLLQDPGFERHDDESRVWTLSGGSNVLDDADLAHSGSRCARARFDDGIAQRIAVKGGAAYRIGGWIRRVQPTGTEVPKIKVYFLDVRGQRADVQAAEIQEVNADDWLRWETTVQAPVQAKTLSLTLRAFFGGTEWFYYDDLSIEEVEAISWPARETTPNLHGMTVTVPDVADVWTDALLRIPPGSLLPIDGQLGSSVLTRGEDIRIQLHSPKPLCWALVHSMRPEMNLGNAALASVHTSPSGTVETRPLATSAPKKELVTSLRFEPALFDEAILTTSKDDPIRINEIQFFGLHSSEATPDEPLQFGLSKANVPDAFAEDFAKVYAAEEHRATLMAGENEDAKGEFELPAEQYVNIFAVPRKERYGLSAIVLDLALSGAEPEDMIEISLLRPEELDVNIRWTTYSDRGLIPSTSRRNYANVFRAVSRVENNRLAVRFDVPDLVYADAEPVWITLRTRHAMTLDLAASHMAFNLVSVAEAYDEYLPQLERLTRRMYSDATEAHVYDSRDWAPMVLGRYVRRVLEMDPENQPVNYIYRRIAQVREPVALTRPGPQDAPDWAVSAHEALKRRHEMITWWLDHRQQANGELAGHINDDGEFSCNWPSQYLMTGDKRIAKGLHQLAEVAWNMSAGTGYTVGARDVEHAAEDQSCTQPQVLLVDYGNPTAIERFMMMSQYLDFWTAVNAQGRRQFKSYMFTTKQIWDDPPYDVDHPYCPLAMVGTGHLLWYTYSPSVEKIFFEEAASWARGCLSDDGGKSAGAIPKEIRFRDSQVNPYRPYPTNPLLQKRNSLYRNGAGAYIVQYFIRGAHSLNQDDLFARVLNHWELPDDRKTQAAQDALKRFLDPAEPRKGDWKPTQSETTLYDAWKVTGKRMWLVEELQEVVRQQIRNQWLLTEAEPYTDRIPMPGRELLSRMFLGDWTSGKSHVPGHWVSWEGGGLDYAALVLDARPDHLKAIVHSFHEQDQPLTMRVWRLPHGRYNITIGIDNNADDQADESIQQQTEELWRYDGAVGFTAHPGKTTVIELSLLEELPDVRIRPDLALERNDVEIEDDVIIATVHNVGGSTAPASSLAILAQDGSVISTAEVPEIAPPHDLQPKIRKIRVRLANEIAPAWVELDPDNEILEITEANNRMRVSDAADENHERLESRER